MSFAIRYFVAITVSVFRPCIRFFQEIFDDYLNLPKGLSEIESRNMLRLKRAARELRLYLRTSERHRTLKVALITDYGPGDPANAKVRAALWSAWGDMGFAGTTEANFDTTALGYDALTQLLAPGHLVPKELVGFLNVAPIFEGDKRNGEHPFYVVLLSNGRIVCSPNSLTSLSFLLPYIEVILEIPCAQNGEQFRSWQCFPKEYARILSGDFRNVARVFTREDDHGIPPLPETVFVREDNFRNAKFALTEASAHDLGYQDGDVLRIIVNGTEVGEAVFGHSEEKDAEQLTLKAGSGIIEPRPGDRIVFLDLFKLYAEALETLGNPGYQDVVTLERKSEFPNGKPRRAHLQVTAEL